jgi:hypothetical protein
LLIVPLVVGLPFAHVGEITPDGQAYRAYFTADYVWRRAVVIELAKGARCRSILTSPATCCTTTGCRTCSPACSIVSPVVGITR